MSRRPDVDKSRPFPPQHVGARLATNAQARKVEDGDTTTSTVRIGGKSPAADIPDGTALCTVCDGQTRICHFCQFPESVCDCDDGCDPVICPKCQGKGTELTEPNLIETNKVDTAGGRQ